MASRANHVEATEQDETRKGMIFGVLAYSAWGVLPIYFRALEAASPLEILAQRIVWSAGFCLLFWLWKRDLGWMGRVFRNARTFGTVTLAAYILALNWGVYIYAVDIGNVLESSLGYFINPLMMVLVGVIVLGERMTKLQWTAIGLGTVAVLIIAIDYGRPPWIALTLAISFTIYGFIKKTQGRSMGALQTMTVESIVLVPFALLALVWIRTHANDLTFTSEGWRHTVLLIFLGVATIAPLSLFTAAATRLPMTTIGMLQFLAPTGQFIVGVFVFHEAVPLSRWIGFGFVWLALAMLTIDSFRRASDRRRMLRLERKRVASLPVDG